jgi:hypothetical protein
VEKKFNTALADSQATAVRPVSPDQFDISAYADYHWADNQAPMVKPPFKSVSEALQYPPEEVAATNIGKHILQD